MFRAFALAMAIVVAIDSGSAASTENTTMVVNESATDFATTVARARAEIEKRGATIVATVDHSAAARKSGLDLRPTTLIIFGNPKLGTPLMRSRQSAGIDLPLRILVWQDADAKTRIGYWPPSQIAEQHNIGNQGEVTSTMTKVLGAIADAAAAR